MVCAFAKRCVLFFELPRFMGKRKTPTSKPVLLVFWWVAPALIVTDCLLVLVCWLGVVVV